MVTQLKNIQDDKINGKWATETQEAADELAYLMTFNQAHRQWL